MLRDWIVELRKATRLRSGFWLALQLDVFFILAQIGQPV